uniref:Putative rna-binding protein 7 n=1 Tax=Phlebotomus kandelakii TaxID=1109342 RepID=A0A6B2EF21_9DIPT
MTDESRTLFCGNLSDKVTEELLYELFLQAGPIDEVRIPKQRSFGFVTYRHEATIPYALNLYSGTRLFGREINVALRSQQSPGNDRDHPGNSLGHGPRGLGQAMGSHMMPQMRPPPTNPASMFGCVVDMEQLLKFGQQLANFPSNFGGSSSSRGDYYGDNRTRDLVDRDKHYRNRDNKKPYGNRRQRNQDNDKGKNSRNNFRDRHYRR